jgi:hypothetical protein
MRIRTVKPEFWANEKLATLPEFTRLMALALLNYADDEGYFNANPALIRGALFPFGDESRRIPGSLQELSRVGYIQIAKADDGRIYGRVIHFQKHQRVDKLKPSQIKDLVKFQDSSTTPPGVFDDESRQEQGSGNRDQGMETFRAPAPASAFALASESSSKPAKAKRHVKRNELLDTLAIIDGADPEQVPPAAWSGYAKAFSEIRAVMPDVTPDELKTRARNYKTKHPEWALTAQALAKRWAECASFSYKPQEQAKACIPEPLGWREYVDSAYPESHYATGGVFGSRKWSEHDREFQTKITNEMKKGAS